MRLAEFLALDEVAEAKGDLNQEVTGLTYDSRKVNPGQIFLPSLACGSMATSSLLQLWSAVRSEWWWSIIGRSPQEQPGSA